MTVQKAIDQFDRLYKNQLDTEIKIDWLKQLEMQITEETVEQHELPEGYETPDWDAFDLSSELIVPEQYVALYIAYLRRMYCFAQAETKGYNMATTEFNNAYITYQQYYNRRYKPKRTVVNYTRGGSCTYDPLNR